MCPTAKHRHRHTKLPPPPRPGQADFGGARTESVKQPKPSSQTTAVNAQAHAKENTNFHIIILNCILNYVLPEPSSNSSLETKNTTSSNYRNNLPCPPHHCCCHLNKRPTWSPNERASEWMMASDLRGQVDYDTRMQSGMVPHQVSSVR